MVKLQKSSKHVPQRTCIACRQESPKWELVRIVRTPEGVVEIDHRGKKTGRGAYLCRRQDCWEIGLKKRRLENALKSDLAPDQRAMLSEYSKTLPTLVEDPPYRAEASSEGALT